METNPPSQLAPNHTTKWWPVILFVTWFKTRTPTMPWKCCKPNSKVLLQRWRILPLYSQVVLADMSLRYASSKMRTRDWFEVTQLRRVVESERSTRVLGSTRVHSKPGYFFVRWLKWLRMIKTIFKILTALYFSSSTASSCKEQFEKYK